MKPSSLRDFFWGYFLIINLFFDSFKSWYYPEYWFHIGWVVAVCVFQGINPLHLNCQVYVYRVVHSVPLLSFWCLQGLYWYLLLHSWYLQCVPSLFFLCLIRGLSILLIFSKNQLFHFVDFSPLKSWHILHLVMMHCSFNIFLNFISLVFCFLIFRPYLQERLIWNAPFL